MFELHCEQITGNNRGMRNYGSMTTTNMHSMQGVPRRFKQVPKLTSVRSPEGRTKSMIPKTAINFYHLRKGLYLKTGARGNSFHTREQVKN